jgi:hypothetical protein
VSKDDVVTALQSHNGHAGKAAGDLDRPHRVDNLCMRFPHVSEDDVVALLQSHNGHVGKAAGDLERETEKHVAAQKVTAEQEQQHEHQQEHQQEHQDHQEQQHNNQLFPPAWQPRVHGKELRRALESLSLSALQAREKELRKQRQDYADEYIKMHWIVGQSSYFRTRWDLCFALLLVYVAVAVPYRIIAAIDPAPWEFAFVFDVFVDIFFIVDIGLNFRTAVWCVATNNAQHCTFDSNGPEVWALPKPVVADMNVAVDRNDELDVITYKPAEIASESSNKI